jgi:site-specific DNA-adenine methylase
MIELNHYKKPHMIKSGQSWSSQAFGGYPGLFHTADKIKKFIPKSKIYVEPFAGLGRTVELHHDKIILNDMSDYAIAELKKRFGNYNNVIITQEQYLDCVKKYDSPDTFFLFDPPYKTSAYAVNPKTFCDRTDTQYFNELKNLVETLQGNWIICSDSSRTGARIFKNTKWYSTIVESDKKVVFGKKSRILLISNKPFNN